MLHRFLAALLFSLTLLSVFAMGFDKQPVKVTVTGRLVARDTTEIHMSVGRNYRTYVFEVMPTSKDSLPRLIKISYRPLQENRRFQNPP